MKIIFISSYSLSKFKYDQLNLSYFIELKQDFTWVDCSYLDNRKYYEDNKNNIFFIDNYVILKSISDLSNVINKNEKTIIIDLLNNNYKSMLIRYFFKKRKIKICNIDIANNPFKLFNANVKNKIINIIRNIILDYRFIRTFINKLLSVFFKFLFQLKPDFVFYTGLNSEVRYPVATNQRIFYSHIFEYDLSLRNKFNTTKKNIIFIDQNFPYHEDFKKHSVVPPVSPRFYYNSIRKFFDHIENVFQSEIIIAAHPKNDNLELSSASYGNRKIQKFVTPNLISESSLVLTHGSLSVSYAIIFSKPIIMLSTNELLNSYYKNYILATSHALKISPINIDKDYCNFDLKKLSIDSTKNHQYYVEKFIKHPLSRQELFWDTFINNIKKSL